MFTLHNVLIVTMVVALILGVQIYFGRRQKAKEITARQEAEAKAAELVRKTGEVVEFIEAFPTQYAELLAYCKEFSGHESVSFQLQRVREHFANARNAMRLGNINSAHSNIVIVRYAVDIARNRTADLTCERESETILRTAR